MDFFIRLLSYFNLAGAIHALIQSMVLVFVPRGNRRANKFMALFLAAVAVAMANGMISILGLYEAWPGLIVFMGSVALSFHPLFFLYIRALTAPDRRVTLSDTLHGVPFLLALALWVAHLSVRAGGADLSGPVGFGVRSPWVFVLIAAALQSVGYIAAIVHSLRAYSMRIKEAYSTIDRIGLGWLRWRLFVYVVIWAVGLASMAVVRFESRGVVLVGQVVAFLAALNTFLMGYRAMLEPESRFGPGESAPGRRYEHSSLTPESAALIKSRLLEWMDREKPFLDPEITLPKLSRALDVPLAHLSRVINDLLGRNFFEFINGYRVEEAKRRLASPAAAGEKLLTVALESGFNSLATFNRVFKERAGRTPSDFRKHPAPR